MSRRWLAPLLALCVLSFVGQAHGQTPPAVGKLSKRKASFHTHKGWVTLSVGYRDVLDKKTRKKLLSGLPTTIVTRAYLFRDGDLAPKHLSVKTCRVVFDLWDEVFRIDRRQSGRRKRTVAVNVEGVLRRCADANAWPVVSTDDLEPRRGHFTAVLVEVNPLSKKMLQQIRRWVARPKGAGAVGPGDSLFGNFVGLFVTQVPESDRRVSFRTPSFVVADLPKLPPKRERVRAPRASR
jgi:hypothetical protein